MANGIFTLKQQQSAIANGTWVLPSKTPSVDYLVVAGGGGAGNNGGGGGGAGGLLAGVSPIDVGSAYTVTVGTGGATSPSSGVAGFNGGSSAFGAISSDGGGGGGYGAPGSAGTNGGSGGGSSAYSSGTNSASGGAGVTGQGNKGGDAKYGGTVNIYDAGGGGAGAAAQSNPGASNQFIPAGGAGVASAIAGTLTAYAGGGGGYGDSGGFAAPGGVGGGGAGGYQASGANGTANTGGGGGGNGGSGGSGIVILSYPDIYPVPASTTGSPTVSTSGSGSLYPNGAGTLQSSTTAPSQSGDFTLECWINYSTTSGYRLFAGTATGANYVGLYAGNFVVNSSTTGAEKQIAISGGAPAINTWFHYCLMRSGSTLYGFINGVLQGSVTFTDTLFAAGYLQVCGYGSTYQFPGYVSNLRLTNTLVYSTAGFTVPTSPLANVTGTALLMNTASGAPYLDASSNAANFAVYSGVIPLWNQLSPFTGTGYKNRVYTWTGNGSVTF